MASRRFLSTVNNNTTLRQIIVHSSSANTNVAYSISSNSSNRCISTYNRFFITTPQQPVTCSPGIHEISIIGCNHLKGGIRRKISNTPAFETKKTPSKRMERKKEKKNNHGFDARSESKLLALSEVKEITDEAKQFHHSIRQKKLGDNDNLELQSAYNSWIQNETKLSDAFSKAIKYTARLRSKDTALKSKHLLDEMIDRHNISSNSKLYSIKSHDDDNVGDIIEIHDDAIFDLVKMIRFSGAHGVDKDKHNDGNHIDSSNIIIFKDSNSIYKENDIISATIPPPTKRDYHNVIHSWGSSKAKKKGLQAETLLWRMLELSYLYPSYFDVPDSRTFALVIKCYAGSTCTYLQHHCFFFASLLRYTKTFFNSIRFK